MTLTEAINQFGFVGVVSFGLTYIVIVIWKEKFKKELTSLTRMIVQLIFAFILAFVPVEIQLIFVKQLQVAVGIVAGMSAFWQFLKAL